MALLIPKKIILHCSATEDTESKSWDAIRRYHIETNGWSDIGYHYGIERYLGNISYQRGRLPNVMGAHCRAAGRNRDSLGVCVVGKFDDRPPADDILIATYKLLSYLCFVFSIAPKDVYGHREFEDGKTCPGLKWDLDETRDNVMVFLSQIESWGGPSVDPYEWSNNDLDD